MGPKTKIKESDWAIGVGSSADCDGMMSKLHHHHHFILNIKREPNWHIRAAAAAAAVDDVLRILILFSSLDRRSLCPMAH